MNCLSKPYEGDKPYLFFSCSPSDAATVYPIIDRLCLHGYRVWFDDGSNPGEAGLDVIADHLRRCTSRGDGTAGVCVAGGIWTTPPTYRRGHTGR